MRNLIAASLVILSINVSNGQTKLGLKLTPGIITQRISYINDNNSVGNGANAFNLTAILFTDIEMSPNYFFTTGIGYTSKRMNIKLKRQGEINTLSKNYNIQYIQIPATINLYTNEISLDKKLFFQFGPLIEIAVHNKENNNEISIIDKFRPLDVTLLFATGLQIQLAPQTAIKIGISYRRGLINVVKSPADGIEDLIIKNDVYGLDLALKF